MALNKLPAVKVDRATAWGNCFAVGLIRCGCRSPGECDHNRFRCESAAQAVEEFRRIPRSERRIAEIKAQLGGKNLACWCKPGAPCHADVLLEIANK